MTPLFSSQQLRCCICGTAYEATAVSGARWADGVCGMRHYYEKQWRCTLSAMGKPYRPDERTYDQHGYPIATERRRG